MAVSNNTNNNSNSKERTQNIKEVEQKLGENPKITLKGGGKTKIMDFEQLRKPHCVRPSARFPVEDTAGGLLRTGGHRPQLSDEEVSKRHHEQSHGQEDH
ncbi:hypothetical protein FQB29_001154 [Saccharomyces cerevisiae]|nr:ALH_1c_G0038390.mRNA.1.CDS.1 [Saccharomyces cerevisiae]CAI4673721.1 ALH_1b_G0038570.mRNA.1.CDS.1 [Saccharomyces cerevisiae]CAI5292631.1 CIC_HP2_G0034130.mRNA.1.CDS.1 [Saccharomyces cerevisiae]CAI5298625.1 AKR_HP2_G0036960.mRNA.1.CDS.1 [Saccharomyces cerevisiae]CAI6607799.1 CIC_HP2_G0034130.mRNA.1.CDS.1 [Saccharomyces cerevisiae]